MFSPSIKIEPCEPRRCKSEDSPEVCQEPCLPKAVNHHLLQGPSLAKKASRSRKQLQPRLICKGKSHKRRKVLPPFLFENSSSSRAIVNCLQCHLFTQIYTQAKPLSSPTDLQRLLTHHIQQIENIFDDLSLNIHTRYPETNDLKEELMDFLRKHNTFRSLFKPPSVLSPISPSPTSPDFSNSAVHQTEAPTSSPADMACVGLFAPIALGRLQGQDTHMVNDGLSPQEQAPEGTPGPSVEGDQIAQAILELAAAVEAGVARDRALTCQWLEGMGMQSKLSWISEMTEAMESFVEYLKAAEKARERNRSGLGPMQAARDIKGADEALWLREGRPSRQECPQEERELA